MGRKPRKPCSHCDTLTQRVSTLEAQLSSVHAETARLQEQLAAAKKNSSTSSKPPSSDIVKPPPAPTAEGSKRTIGGQPGHSRHERLGPWDFCMGRNSGLLYLLCPNSLGNS